jgi:hypothetical protein
VQAQQRKRLDSDPELESAPNQQAIVFETHRQDLKTRHEGHQPIQGLVETVISHGIEIMRVRRTE